MARHRLVKVSNGLFGQQKWANVSRVPDGAGRVETKELSANKMASRIAAPSNVILTAGLVWNSNEQRLSNTDYRAAVHVDKERFPRDNIDGQTAPKKRGANKRLDCETKIRVGSGYADPPFMRADPLLPRSTASIIESNVSGSCPHTLSLRRS